MHDQVCKFGHPTTRKIHGLATKARLKRFKRKDRRIGSRGHVPTNKRNSVLGRLLPAIVVDYCQPGKQHRQSMSLFDDSNSSLFELGKAAR